jgi:lysophospholipase L1-like esterase
MLTDPSATTVLCYGDSNTHGTPGDDPEFVRFGADIRWPGRLQNLLGAGWNVVEEGLNGRTVNTDYPDRPGLNGSSYLIPCLLSHSPLDIVVVMLGSNDTKLEFGLTVEHIVANLDGLIDLLFANSWTSALKPPQVVLVSPIHIDPTQPRFGDDAPSTNYESVAKSLELSRAYQKLAQRRGLTFFDAATVADAVGDGLHMDADGHANLAAALADVIRPLK